MRTRRIVATMLGAAAIVAAGASAASATAPTSCRSTAGYITCSLFGSSGPASTLYNAVDDAADDAVTDAIGPGFHPMPA